MSWHSFKGVYDTSRCDGQTDWRCLGTSGTFKSLISFLIRTFTCHTQYTLDSWKIPMVNSQGQQRLSERCLAHLKRYLLFLLILSSHFLAFTPFIKALAELGDKTDYLVIFFFKSSYNICCYPSSELSPWGSSNEGSLNMFLWRNEIDSLELSKQKLLSVALCGTRMVHMFDVTHSGIYECWVRSML